jgi:TonB-dependent SusC/RagA subfamily outer membrane receptor
MARPRRIARSALPFLAAALSAAACHRATGEAPPNPGPFMPPPAVAAGPTDSVSAADVGDQRVVRAEEMIRGRFAGVEVIALPGGGISVRIRGATSFNASTEPLYVVDGVTVTPEPGGALKWLAPRDIQRIEVLKDPASTAFYGSRGANGVIVVTTKH